MRYLIAAAALAAAIAAPATAQDAATHEIAGTDRVSIDLDAPFDEDIVRGISAISAARPKDAIAIFDRVIVAYEAKHSGRSAYCAESLEDASRIMVPRMASGSEEEPEIEILGPNWCQALWGKGFALIDLNRPGEAEEYLAEAVQRAPTNAHYLNELAELHKSRGEWQRSHDMFAHAFELTAQDIEADDANVAARSLRGIGYNLIELDRLDEAEQAYRRSLEFQPEHEGAKGELQFIAQRKAIRAGD